MARRGAYNRRGRGSWQPSDRQRQVLDLLVERKSNAEIAARLGITVDGAKWHVGELLAETGCEDRRRLAQWWAERRGQHRRAAFVPLLVAQMRHGWPAVAVGFVVAIGLMAFLLSRGGDNVRDVSAPEAAADFEPAATPTPIESTAAGSRPPCEPSLPGGYRLVTADELRAEGLIEFGQVIEPRSCPMRVDNRADLSFLWLADGGLIEAEEAGLHGISRWGLGPWVSGVGAMGPATSVSITRTSSSALTSGYMTQINASLLKSTAGTSS